MEVGDGAVGALEHVSQSIIHGELDGFLWRDADQVGDEAAVEAPGALLPEDGSEAVDGTLVLEFDAIDLSLHHESVRLCVPGDGS